MNAEYFRSNVYRDGNRGLTIDGKRVLAIEEAAPARQQSIPEEMIKSASIRKAIIDNRDPPAHIRIHKQLFTY